MTRTTIPDIPRYAAAVRETRDTCRDRNFFFCSFVPYFAFCFFLVTMVGSQRGAKPSAVEDDNTTIFTGVEELCAYSE